MIHKPKFNLKDTVYIDRKFSSLSSSFFKPIVATSLLFLLPSLGMGEDATHTWSVQGSTGPKINITSTETTQPTHLSWSNPCSSVSSCATSAASTDTTSTTAINWTNTSNTWGGAVNGNKIASLALRFDNTDTTTQTQSFVTSTTSSGSSTSTATVSVYAPTSNATDITADFENKNLGTSTDKTNLELKFGSTVTGTKNVTVKNLDTLNGTLYIISTATVSKGTAEDRYIYDITLNTLNGILVIQGSNFLLNGTVTIKNTLNGSIYLSADSSPGGTSTAGTDSSTAALTVNFANGATMTGDIADRTNGYGGIRKDIKFAGSGTVLTGNIVSFGTSSLSELLNFSTGNRVYFTQGDMTGYIIASTGHASGGLASDASKKGLNVVIFGDTASSTTHTLTGGILASDVNRRDASTDTSPLQATNVIVLADNTTLNINTDSNSGTLTGSFAGGQVVGGDDAQKGDTQFEVTSGSIVARNFGINEIRIYKDSTLNLNNGSGSIQSVITSKSSVTTDSNGTTTTGTTVTNGSALNKINFLSENGVINGSIVADNSGNSSSTTKQASALIYVANNASGTITGNLEVKAQTSGSKTNGRLTITLGSSNTTSVTGGDVTNKGNNNSITDNSSTLTLQGSSNTITELTVTGINSNGGIVTDSSTAANTANLVLDSSKSGTTTGQTTAITGAITNNASKLNFIFKGNNQSTLDLSGASGSGSNIDAEVQEGVSATIATKDTPSSTNNHTITFASGSSGSLTIGKKETASTAATDSSVTVASNPSLSVSANTLTLNFYGNGTLNDGLTVSSSGTAAISVGGDKGGVSATLNGVLTNSGTSASSGADTKATSTSAITLTFHGNNNTLNLNGTGSSTNTAGSSVSQTIDTLSGSGSGNVINLSSISMDSTSRSTFQTLTVKSLTASSPTTFLLYVNPNATTSSSGGSDSATVAAADSSGSASSTTVLADRVIIEGNGTTTTQNTNANTPGTVHYLSITGNATDLTSGDLSSKNIALATVKTSSGITLQATESTIGFNTVKFTMTTKSTKEDGTVDSSTSGSNDYTTYFLGSATYTGMAETDMTKSARNSLALGYNLFLANFNSLNKRMGELRNNAHSQGVWGRIFSGPRIYLDR